MSSTVRSFGTEDRPAPKHIPPRNETYEFIIFRGSDIKDLHVSGMAGKPEEAPPDPAILSVSSVSWIQYCFMNCFAAHCPPLPFSSPPLPSPPLPSPPLPSSMLPLPPPLHPPTLSLSSYNPTHKVPRPELPRTTHLQLAQAWERIARLECLTSGHP